MPHPQFDQVLKKKGRALYGDFARTEMRVLQQMILNGVAVTEISTRQARQLGKTIQYMVVDDYWKHLNPKGARSLRNRHHNRKDQPNCGPRKPNQW